MWANGSVSLDCACDTSCAKPPGFRRGEEALRRRFVTDAADRLIEQVTPSTAISRWTAGRYIGCPWSGWCSRASGLPRRQIAIHSASAPSWAAILSLTDQLITRQENRPIMAARTAIFRRSKGGEVCESPPVKWLAASAVYWWPRTWSATPHRRFNAMQARSSGSGRDVDRKIGPNYR